MSEIAEQLSCQELVELVTDYLDGALPPAGRARFDAHIADCDGCRAYLEQIRATIALTGTLAPEQLAPEAEAALLEAFRDWKRRP
jgi:anti-sigma factor RsiW